MQKKYNISRSRTITDRLAFVAISVLAPMVSVTNARALERPGPSLALFNAPYYSCETNYYVATDGSNLNDGSSPATAWETLQFANDSLPKGGAAAGTCVNVLPGTYTKGVLISAGGNLAASSGYVTYRCTTMDACTVTDVNAGGWNGSFVFNPTQPMTGNYVVIDGFNLTAAAETEFGQGIELSASNNTFIPSVHHVYILNSIISGYGQAGINMNQGEYFFVIHNVVYGNANKGCTAQGSGIAFVIEEALSNYTRTPDDGANKMYGSIGTEFHNVVEWNKVYNNATTMCGNESNPYDTDGNNIIVDTLSWHGTQGATPYLPGTLVAFNLVYNSGGGGVHIFYSENVTAANNTCYNAYLDPYNQGAARACIDTLDSYGNTLINNIAVGIPLAPVGSCAFYGTPYADFNSATIGSPPQGEKPDTWSQNITQLQGGRESCWGQVGEDTSWNSDTYSCSLNKCDTDPNWVNAGTTSTGNETTPPDGANFALKPSSPAIGYGLRETYLSSQSVDAGACYHTAANCGN
jgi:hypothetical protein